VSATSRLSRLGPNIFARLLALPLDAIDGNTTSLPSIFAEGVVKAPSPIPRASSRDPFSISSWRARIAVESCPSMSQTLAERSAAQTDLSTDDRDRPLPVTGFKGTHEEIERKWYEEVYRGRGDSMAQLTWRAVLVGSCLGGVLSLTNLYIGLKAGWGFGVATTASILSYAIWTSLLKVGLGRTPMTILENNCMQSAASSAGYSTGGTLVSAFAAYIIINHQSMSVPLMLPWVFFIAVLGVTRAIPMKRQMINIEQLRFPSGIAAAETLRALHSKSSQGLRAAKALGLAGVVAAIDKVWAKGLSTISPSLERFSSSALLTDLQKWLLGGDYEAWAGRTVVFSWDFIFLAAGAITGMRVCATMFVSGTLCWAVVVPILQSKHHRSCGLRGHRAVDALVWRVLHGDIGTAEFCAQLAHGIERIP
jgi:hypothetical protein